MIVAEVHQDDKLILSKVYHDPSLSLERVLQSLETYIVNEQLNTKGECMCRVRFQDLAKGSSKHETELDLSSYINHTFDKMRGIN